MIRRRLLVAACATSIIHASPSFAGRPLNINDAPALDPRNIQIEAGVGYVKDSDCDHYDLPIAVTYGVTPGLEAGIGFGGQFEQRTETDGETIHEDGLGDLTVGAKWNPVIEQGLLPALAIGPQVKFPTASRDDDLGSGEIDYDLTAIATKSFGDAAAVHANAGYSWIGDPDSENLDDLVHYGIALEIQLHPKAQWVGEVFAQDELTSSADTVVQYNTGFRVDAVENVTIDIAGGSGISGDAPDFAATLGLTWVFGG